jgi:hypothetical protein
MLKCLKFKHIYKSVYLFITCLWCLQALAQVSPIIKRKPANFVPDDDMILVPMVVERSFIEEFNEKHKDEFREAKRKIEYWMTQEQYARDYGLENTGAFEQPTPEDKQQFFNRHYLRFLQKEVETSNQQTMTNWMNEWNTNDEIDAIRANEQRDDFIVKAKRDKGQKVYETKKEVKVGEKSFRFDIQPRIEMGMIRVTINTPLFDIRAWVGVNGNQEVKIERHIAATKTHAFVNYYIEQQRTLGVIDQPLLANWSLRLTHEKYTDGEDALLRGFFPENNTVQLRFGMGF